MSLYIFPSSSLCGRRFCPVPSLFDDFLEDFDIIERALRPLQTSMAFQHKDDSPGCLDKVVDDESKLAISLNVANFKPEDLKVDLDGRILKIEGKQEVKEKNGYSSRSFIRQWTLPDNVDVERIKPSITEDGHLCIEAPKITKPSITSRNLPIGKADK
ncbi:Hsp20/alpha crystallin family protein [Necator americanus]|uniref:Hsp20/alpha crystallin family protein n=1 Tax=Necator americanus TaxID=51031 RepID=W2TSJ0_NECAM|nr:Hsp20/alpha crystallin family protein [Necator americanus]ETN83997.1 Hsp20/alpha crystallin family protein [Necator americanus]